MNDVRTLRWPELAAMKKPFGSDGGLRREGMYGVYSIVKVTLTLEATTIQHDFFNYFSSGIDGGVENRPVVDNVLRPNPEACHIRYLPPYTY